MCYLAVWNLRTRSWETLPNKKPKEGALAHAIVCTSNQNSSEQPEDTACLPSVKNLPVYRLGIECECSCKDCLEILQSFQGN